MFSFLSGFKTYIAAAVAGVMAIFGILFYKRGRDIDELEKDKQILQTEKVISDANVQVVKKEVEEARKSSETQKEIIQSLNKIEKDSRSNLEKIKDNLKKEEKTTEDLALSENHGFEEIRI